MPLCGGGEVTGETCYTELSSGFYNESNVKSPYKATITPACFFCWGFTKGDLTGNFFFFLLGCHFQLKGSAVQILFSYYFTLPERSVHFKFEAIVQNLSEEDKIVF